MALLYEGLESIVLMLAPITPHITQVLWEQAFNHDSLIINMPWPTPNQQALIQEQIQMIVQVNGKLRDKIFVTSGANKTQIEKTALNCKKIQPFIANKNIKKIITVPNKLVNIVV